GPDRGPRPRQHRSRRPRRVARGGPRDQARRGRPQIGAHGRRRGGRRARGGRTERSRRAMRLVRGLLAVAYPFAVFAVLRWLEPRWDHRVLLLVPAFINLGLLFAFGRTLRRGPTLVEQLAR